MAPRYANSSDGTRIAFGVSGSGPVVMLLHGGGQTRRAWHDAGYVPRLAKEFTVITVDLRGNGESDKPAQAPAYAIDGLTDDLLAVADAARAGTLDTQALAEPDRAVWQRGTVAVSLAWMSAMLDYPPVEPRDMTCPTLWLAGTANSGAMESTKEYGPKLAGTQVTVALLDGLTHAQEFDNIDLAFPYEIAFTRSHACRADFTPP